MSNQRLTIKQAAELLGVSQQFLRIGLQQDKFPFGTAVKTSPSRYTYYISADRLLAYLGAKLDESLYQDFTIKSEENAI